MDGVDDPGGGGDQNDAHGHDTGGDQSQDALLKKAIHISLNGLLGGIVNVGAGDQRDQGDDQIGDGWVFSDPGHDLCVGSSKHCAKEAAHGVAETKMVGGTENGPGEKAAQSAQPAAASVDIPDKEKADTGHKCGDAGRQV